MTSFLYAETSEAHLITQGTHRAEFYRYTGARGSGRRLATGARRPGPGLGEWLTFLPGRAWGLGLRVSLV